MDSRTSVYLRHWLALNIVITICISTVLGNISELPEYLVEENEAYCPDFKTPSMPIVHVPWNTPFRAQRTLPVGVIISPSAIPDAGLGAFSQTFIKRHTILAEFEGEVVIKLSQISDYAWKVKRHGKKSFYIDAHDEDNSNWLRWINCSRNSREENVEVWQCHSKMYYVTSRDIHPGEELLVYYGDGYARYLNIDVDNYDNVGGLNSYNTDGTLCTQNCSDTEQ